MINMPLKSSIGMAARNPIASSSSNPAPVGGLNTRDVEAAMRPIYATLMENFWPQERFVGVRGGAEKHCPAPSTIKQLGSWNGPTDKQPFAFTDSGAYDVTIPAITSPALAQAFTSGDMVLTNYSTSAGSYLVGVNTKDDYFYYKSPTWTTVATMPVTNGTAGEVINTNKFSFISSHARALFFIEKDSTNFYFLPIDSVTGSVNRFPIGGLFRKGGKLVGMGSWTIDGGDGPDDLAVFLSSEGQAAVYSGTDPSSANGWTLRGVFDIGRPLGLNPFFKLGGDLLILTTYGLTSMSKLAKEGWTSSKTTITDIISAYFQSVVQGAESSLEWKVTADPKLSLLLISCPPTDERRRLQLAMNLVTGAWTVFKGWESSCWELFQGQLYTGVGSDVAKVWTTSKDFGSRINCYVRCAWTYLSPKARTKQVNLVRYLSRIAGELTMAGGMDVDFEYSENFYNIPATLYPISRFDGAKFDANTWGALEKMQLDWLTIPCQEGYCVAPRLRVFAGDATFQWSAIDFTYTVGSLVG